MSVVLAVRVRRVLTGFLVLALLVMSFSETFAATRQSLGPSDLSIHTVAAADARAFVTAAGQLGSPSDHHNCADCPSCCVCGCCFMLSGYLPVTVAAPMPVISAAQMKPDVGVPAPDGLGLAPALPPPRRTV